MKINGKLVFDASGASEIQRLRIEKVSTNPVWGTADTGRLIWNTTEDIIYVGTSVKWVAIATGGDAASLQAEVDRIEASLGTAVNADGSFNSNAFPSFLTAIGTAPTSITEAINMLVTYADAHNTLAELDDVNVAGKGDNALLQYDATSGKWVARSLAQAGVQPHDTTLDALAGFDQPGIMVETATDTFVARSLVAPAQGVTIANADGVAGNPTFALANDLAALEGLTTTGFVIRTADGAATTRTLTIGSKLIGSNLDGIGGAPLLDLNKPQISTAGTFQKFRIDTYGIVNGVLPVVAADITALVDSTYVNTTGDTMTGDLGMSGHTVTGLATPVNPTDAVNKAYLEAKLNGLSWKDAVQVATGSNINLMTAQTTLDGVNLVYPARVLVMGQTNPRENGIYVYDTLNGNPIAPVRATDLLAASDFDGAAVFVKEGTYASTAWTETATVTDVFNPPTGHFTGGPVTFVQFFGGSVYVAGVGLDLTGNTFSVNLGAGIVEGPVDGVGIDLFGQGALILTEDGASRSTSGASKLGLLLDAAGGLSQTSSGLAIADGALVNSKLAHASFSVATSDGTLSIALGDTYAIQGVDALSVHDNAGAVEIRARAATDTLVGVASFQTGEFGVDGYGHVTLTATLDKLTGVNGTDAAADGSVLRKISGIWTATSVANLSLDMRLRDLGDTSLMAGLAPGSTIVYNSTSDKFESAKIFYVHDAATAATSWVVNHDLGVKYTTVVIVDDTDEVIIPESITYNSSTQLTVTFNIPVAGKAVVMGVAGL